MISKDWAPDQMDKVEQKWSLVTVPTENISAPDAERLMNTYLLIREDWVDQYTNATLYAEKMKYKRDVAFRMAYFTSNGKSERAKEMDAKSAQGVMTAELQLIEAETFVTRAKMKVDSATLAHHSIKAIYNKAQEEMWLQRS